MIRLLLADDQTLLRRGLEGMCDLTDDLRVVAEAADGDEFLVQLERHEVDVIVLDVCMPKRSGVEVPLELKKGGRSIPALLLSNYRLGLDRCGPVARVGLEIDRGEGSGFLVRGADLDPRLGPIPCR